MVESTKEAALGDGVGVLWLRERTTVYRLHQQGWRKGEPVMVNEVSISVHVDPKSGLDAEAMAEQVRAALNVPTRPPASAEVLASIARLDAIRSQVDWWVKSNTDDRAREGLASGPETHLISPPSWPTHGQLGNWSAALAEAADLLERLGTEGRGHG